MAHIMRLYIHNNVSSLLRPAGWKHVSRGHNTTDPQPTYLVLAPNAIAFILPLHLLPHPLPSRHRNTQGEISENSQSPSMERVKIMRVVIDEPQRH